MAQRAGLRSVKLCPIASTNSAENAGLTYSVLNSPSGGGLTRKIDRSFIYINSLDLAGLRSPSSFPDGTTTRSKIDGILI